LEELVAHDPLIGYLEKTIHIDWDSDYLFNYEQQTDHLQRLTSYLKDEQPFYKSGDSFPKNCHSNRSPTTDPDASFQFLPVWTGKVSPSNPVLELEGNCFEKVRMEMHYEEGADSVQLVV
jgi:hypothetical protein